MAQQKFKLGGAPKAFDKSIELVQHDGAVIKVAFSFIYRTRIELAELMDEKFAADAAASKAAKDQAEQAVEQVLAAAEAGTRAPAPDQNAQPALSVAEVVRAGAAEAADWALKLASGWDLDEKFTKENLMQLEYQFPGTLDTVQLTYRKAVMEHRVKN